MFTNQLIQGGKLIISGLLFSVGVMGIMVNRASSQQVTSDHSLGTQVNINGNNIQIQGGTNVGNTNLFHSFSNFSVQSLQTVYFQNPLDIKNILVRVTGGNPSYIEGLLKAQGNANLLLMNPAGIQFVGVNARLQISGSFLATTANAIAFPNGGEFSLTSPVNPSNPLLAVNPSALLFNQTTPQLISFTRTGIFSVPDGQSLLLVGGNVTIEQSLVAAPSGRVELGGLAGVGTVNLNFDSPNFRLTFPNSVNLADVSVNSSRVRATTDKRSGGVQVQGRRIIVADNSQISVNTVSSQPGGTLLLNASELLELAGQSRVQSQTVSSGQAGNVNINTRQLIVKDGSQLEAITSQFSQGRGGFLIVKADSVQVIGTAEGNRSRISVLTAGSGDAGTLNIETRNLRVGDGARVSATTNSSGRAGNLNIIAPTGTVEVFGSDSRITSGTGDRGTGPAGSLTMTVGELLVQDNAQVSVSSRNVGNAGDLAINANTIKLDQKGQIIAETPAGNGGNITLQPQNLLLLRRGGTISTTAGTANAGGNGGNITINTPKGFIVAAPGENSDITANAFNGAGGLVNINAAGIFGIVPRSREELVNLLSPNDPDPRNLQSNDITAISRNNPNLSGTVTINTPDTDPNQGLVNLPTEPETTQLAQGCDVGAIANQSEFTITGRGGLPPNPNAPLSSDGVKVDWVTVNPDAQYQTSATIQPQLPQPPIVEANGWMVSDQGEILLTSNTSTVSPANSWYSSPTCRATTTSQSTVRTGNEL